MSLDTKVKNLIINTNMTKEQYEAVDDKSNQLFFVEDSSVVDVPSPEENQSGYLHTDGVNLTWKEIEVDNFLPLSGGTIDGDLTIKSSGSSTVEPLLTLSYGSSDVVIKKVRYGKELDFDNTKISGLAGVVPTQSTGQLGASGAFWSKAYIRNLNAGAPSGKDLLVPSKEGTLATLEDIPEDTQLETLPTASADNLNKIYQYVGETTSDYVNGHFYKCINNIIQDWFTNGYAQYDTSLTLIITVDQEKFLAQNPVWQDLGEGTKVWRADYDESTSEWYVWTQQPNIYISNADLKDIWGIDVTNAAGDYVPANGDTLLIQLSETEEFMWEQINVQPVPEVDTLPDQTDSAGKFLTTDGTTASWGNAIVNTATTNNQLNITTLNGTAITPDRGGTSINIGENIYGGKYNDHGGIRIGKKINSQKYEYSGGIFMSQSGIDYAGGGVILNGHANSCLGNNSGKVGGIIINGYGDLGITTKGACSVLIGGTVSYTFRLKADYTTVINNGAGGTVTEDNTFWWGNQNGLYKLFDTDGTIPLERLKLVTDQIGDISTALTAILGE